VTARALTSALLALAALAAPGAARADDVVSIPTKFPVENVNRSAVACMSDGKPYELHGEIVGPRSVLLGGAKATATLYLHEFSFDDFWHFRSAPGVDYATEMARAGHVSVALDRLGYDDSPRPPGNDTCLGAQADMASQIVTELRSGTYRPAEGAPRKFDRVVLAGHSVGGEVAQAVAYSFGGIDGLMLFGVVDQGFEPAATQLAVEQGTVCARGGEESEPGGPGGYAFFSQRIEDFNHFSFFDTDPRVVAAQDALRHRDPCGDVNSNVPNIAADNAHVGEIKVPVLLLYGLNDPVMTSDGQHQQSQMYTGSGDVRTAYFDRTAHGMVLERSAPQIRGTVSRWLGERGFGSETPAASAPRGCPLRASTLVGSSHSDRLDGSAAADSLFGLGGNDRLSGRVGGDCMRGGAGADLLLGAQGADRLYGDSGPDRLSGGTGADRLDGGSGRDRLRGGAGDDRLHARDGAADLVDCGPGSGDRAVVDRRDTVRGCEHVSR
jgi:pimeloyl-ACP methyl ester carboxylesterase